MAIRFMGEISDYCAEGPCEFEVVAERSNIIISYAPEAGGQPVVREILPVAPLLQAIMPEAENPRPIDGVALINLMERRRV